MIRACLSYQICQTTGWEISEGKGQSPWSEGPQLCVPAAAGDEGPEEPSEACLGPPASMPGSRASFLLLTICAEPRWSFPLGGTSLTFIRMIYYNLVPSVL